jgi:hypothetical protein
MKTEKQQSAVEFAVGQLEKFIPKGNQIAIYAILEQAKEMEKEQLKEMYLKGIENYDPTFKKKVNGPK